MEDTYPLQAIILKRTVFRENDSKVVFFSREKGKLEMVARGTTKIKSKLAGHIEPLTLVNLMAVKGRQFDYVGSAIGEKYYQDIKNDLDKLQAVGRAIHLFDKLVKLGEKDEAMFTLLKNYLDQLEENESGDIILEKNIFSLKLVSLLGYAPQLFNCLECNCKVKPGSNSFDYSKGGIICPACSQIKRTPTMMAASDDSIKMLRVLSSQDFNKQTSLKVRKKIVLEVNKIIDNFIKYNF